MGFPLAEPCKTGTVLIEVTTQHKVSIDVHDQCRTLEAMMRRAEWRVEDGGEELGEPSKPPIVEAIDAYTSGTVTPDGWTA